MLCRARLPARRSRDGDREHVRISGPGGALGPQGGDLHRHQNAARADLPQGHSHPQAAGGAAVRGGLPQGAKQLPLPPSIRRDVAAAGVRDSGGSEVLAAHSTVGRPDRGRRPRGAGSARQFFCVARAVHHAGDLPGNGLPTVRALLCDSKQGSYCGQTVPRQVSGVGTVCPQYEPCFVTRSRRWAEQADLVVVNHHLFFADLAIRSSQGTRGEGVLPHYDAVVFDEAHALEEVATDYFGRQISNRRMEDLASDAIRADGSGEHRVGALSAVANRIREQSEALFHALPHTLSLPSGDGSYRLEAKNLEPLDGHFDALLQSLTAAGALGSSSDQPELIAVSRRAVELAADLEFIWKARAMDHVYWVERRGRGVFLRAAPIDIGGELRRRLYPSVDTLVFTSATLTVSGRFDYFSRRIGLSEDQPPLSPLARISVDSPFDFRRQAALYVPARLPDPNSPEFPRAVADEIVRLVQITGGRAFALFTSLRT